MTNQITPQTTLSEIFEIPVFKGGEIISFLYGSRLGGEVRREKSLLDIEQANETWNAEEMAQGLNYLIELLENGEKCFYNIYSDKEIKEDKRKTDTRLCFLPGEPGAEFVLILPGGGYLLVTSIIEGFPVGRALNRKGINAFILNYRAGFDGSFYRAMEDVERALEFIKSSPEFNVKKTNFALMGFSAGGHLAATCSTDNLGFSAESGNRPACIISGYPMTTYNRAFYKVIGANMLGLGSELHLDDTDILKHVGSDFSPVYLWQCKDDRIVDPLHGEAFDKKLDEMGIRHIFREFATGGHGCGLASTAEPSGWLDEAVNFWLNPISEQ